MVFCLKRFVGRRVVVKTEVGEVEGLLVAVYRSRHGGYGSLVIKASNGFVLVKCWFCVVRL